MPQGVRRDDWTVPELFARWGSILYGSRGGGNRRLMVSFRLPYPANKEPILRQHLAAAGITAQWQHIEGWARGGGHPLGTRFPRPQAFCQLFGGQALAFFASIDWHCGNPRRDRAMMLWRTQADAPELSRIAL